MRVVHEQVADEYAERPSTEPTDRSTLRVTMTIVSPDAEQGDQGGAR